MDLLKMFKFSAVVVMLVLVAVSVSSAQPEPNDRPVIGIMAQADGAHSAQHMYIAASYVKFVESAGARVVPILSNLTESDYKDLYQKLNGLLLPGGAASLETSGYIKGAQVFFDLAKDYFLSSGDVFPIWGTCLGFEALTNLGAGKNVLSSIAGAVDVNYPLNLTSLAETSRLFGTMPAALLQALRSKRITYNHHQYGASKHTYDVDPALRATYKVLSTNVDAKGLEFVSTIEGLHLPFFGIQWHSEKNTFEWNTEEHISHDPAAVSVMQHIASVFVNTARQSQHRFASTEDTESHLIYNFAPVYTGLNGSHFEQSYLWPMPGHEVDVKLFVNNLRSQGNSMQ